MEGIDIGKARNYPIFEMAVELSQIAQKMKDFETKNSSKTDTGFSELFQPIVDNSVVMPIFIAKMVSDDEYMFKMETAFKIGISGKALKVAIDEFFEVNNQKKGHDSYRNFVQEKLEDFREEFIAFFQGLDTTDAIPDPWGIFNPPNMNSLDYYKD